MKRKKIQNVDERCGQCEHVVPHKDLAFDTKKPFWGFCPYLKHSVLFSEYRCETNFKKKQNEE